MLEAHPDFDPHDLKHEGTKSATSTHVNEPYVFEKFPLVLYKGEDKTTRTVKDEAEYEAAKGEGFAEA